ncbi:preprotein translocase subunit YajC [Kocuria sp. JC486]|uniref:Preprotein translocase subunit YajC n=1 Tax=Kocuria soli TaxID=2485125 RepID=A0A3N3ZUB3_9MICC|nr:preprotein translocase subunit YajC [Kocuria soli]NHU84154.1 preprotein translocase subunit YajC [Kocuria sp. JC486]ROZ64700.1 preprotein translocase subunit YajC [Kocuria soli]
MLSALITPELTPQVVAQTETSLSAAEQTTGGPGQFLFLGVMLALLVAMFWFTSRNRRKQQQKLQDQQSRMVPGTQVMTSYGLYGRVVSIDKDAVKAVLEIAPNTQVTVHLQTLSTVVDESAGAAGESAVDPTADREDRADRGSDRDHDGGATSTDDK